MREREVPAHAAEEAQPLFDADVDVDVAAELLVVSKQLSEVREENLAKTLKLEVSLLPTDHIAVALVTSSVCSL